MELTLFDTAVGPCGIAWSERGVTGVQLPERDERATRARLMRRFPDASEAAPPAHIACAIDQIAALLRGEHQQLNDIALDMARVPDFNQRVYAIARNIPAGQTLA